MWTCGACGRSFGRKGQGHECAPAMTFDEYFATEPPWEREVFEAVRDHLEALGPVHIEPVSVGILFKKARTFVELRPMARWESVSFLLPRRLRHDRITRTIPMPHGGCYHAIRATRAADIDDQVREWLTESYLSEGAPTA